MENFTPPTAGSEFNEQVINLEGNFIPYLSIETKLSFFFKELQDDTVLPQELINLLNKQSFNGTLIEDNEVSSNQIGSSLENNSCNASETSSDSLNCDTNNNLANLKSNTTSISSLTSGNTNQENETIIHDDENYDQFEDDLKPKNHSSTTIKRSHLINLIYELYDLGNQTSVCENKNEAFKVPKILVQSFMEKLPPGKNLKNSILLTWKKRYFRLNSIGELHVFDIDTKNGMLKDRPDEVYNLMGGKAEFDQNKIISLDDGRGNYMVFRCCVGAEESDEMYLKWKNEIEQQIVDRSECLWVKPNQPLTLNPSHITKDRNVLIIDIGTCSIRAGLFDKERNLSTHFVN